MRVFLKKKNAEAIGEYYPEEKLFIVKSGSRVSDAISASATFKSIRTIEKYRLKYVVDGIVQSDVHFKSSSSAANFVTGRSTNGLLVWKDENGIPLKELL